MVRQQGEGLGERLQHALLALLRPDSRAVITGTGSPELGSRVFRRAVEELRWCEAVLGLCPDGGYCLIGLRTGVPPLLRQGLLRGDRWGSRWALRDTMANLLRAGLSCSLLESAEDVDAFSANGAGVGSPPPRSCDVEILQPVFGLRDRA
jgi:glycosyltransferase A (GT-A) superfamily protein (DUF2064 family)